jgi:hypothetical protein
MAQPGLLDHALSVLLESGAWGLGMTFVLDWLVGSALIYGSVYGGILIAKKEGRRPMPAAILGGCLGPVGLAIYFVYVRLTRNANRPPAG